MKKEFLLLLISILVGCNSKPMPASEVKENKEDFKSYVGTLDRIQLPLNHSSTSLLPNLSSNYDTASFKKYKYISASHPLGVLFENEQGIVIMDYSIGDSGHAPFIISYDLDGNKIDSMGIYKKSGTDIGYEAVEFLTITNDRIITVIDSVKRWQINQAGDNIIESSLKVSVDTTTYKVNDKGEIIRKPAANKN